MEKDEVLLKVYSEIKEMKAEHKNTTAVLVDRKFHSEIKEILLAQGYDVWCIQDDENENHTEDYIGIEW